MGDISEAMERIAKEAERQGFRVRQTAEATWHFRRGNDNALVVARTVTDLLEALRVLIALGFEWSVNLD